MAPTSKEITALWKREVFDKPQIHVAYTPRVYAYDVTATQKSTDDLEQLKPNGEVNFVQYFVQRNRADDQVGCCGTYKYRVQIQYYREDNCDNQLDIQAFFETVDDLVTANLGNRWDDAVSSSSRDENFPDIRFGGIIDGKAVYVGTYNYFAEASC